MRLIPIECVRESSCLGRTIYDDNGRILLKTGTKLTKAVIKKIQEMKIYSIYIVDEYSKEEVEDVIRPELRQKSIAVVKETFNNIERIAKEKEPGPKAALIKKNNEYFRSIYSVAEEMISNILSNNNILVSLVDIKSMDNYTYQHSVNVAVISLVMGISLKMHKRDLLELCLGALTHDIGKAFIPKDITTKNTDFTIEENSKYKEHTQKGYDYLRSNFSLKAGSRMASLQHHERIDGLGYPEGITGDKIHEYAKIVSIANCYDVLTSDCAYRRSIPASDALEYIMAHVNTLFDFDLVNLFSRIIVTYPAGTIVKLSNGDIASVQSTPPNFPLRPTVKIIKSIDKGREGQVIDLLNELSLVVINVEYNI
ncbi:HD-GYP domain-containing protein [Clostridium paraputrificum]|uniref:HD-GYP domain-containing protein n=1 Tax=Clostridium TaxID=1485 RepID=UPI003D33589C